MKEYFFNYYPLFNCIADKCKHTCCAGWELCIDDKSLDGYKKETSFFAPVLMDGINFKKSKFKSDKNKRCAFLNDDGLCNIILNLGESRLCQVCRDHPRFRNFFGNVIETGLGFCCEQSTRIILSFKDKIKPVIDKNEDTITPLDFKTERILEFRQSILDIIQDRNTPINDRIELITNKSNLAFNEQDYKKIIKTFLRLERLDKGWTARLKRLLKTPLDKNTDNVLSHYAEQFLSNCIYRHVSSAEDVIDARARVGACIFSWWIIKSIISTELAKTDDDFELIVDVIRAFSSEVEYSEKNLSKLFTFTRKYVKI